MLLPPLTKAFSLEVLGGVLRGQLHLLHTPPQIGIHYSNRPQSCSWRYLKYGVAWLSETKGRYVPCSSKMKGGTLQDMKANKPMLHKTA